MEKLSPCSLNSNRNKIVQMVHSKSSFVNSPLHVIRFLTVFGVNSIHCVQHFIDKICFVYFIQLSITLSTTINDDYWFILCVFRKMKRFSSLSIPVPKQTNRKLTYIQRNKTGKYSINNRKIIWFLRIEN